MWLNIPFNINKEAISAFIGLNSSNGLLVLKSIKNQKVTNATGAQFDKRAMIIKDIAKMDVKFSSMVIGYKLYHSNRDNSVFGTTIYAAYQMVKENENYELCELLRSQQMENLGKIKKDKKKSFIYGNLLLCLFFIS